MTVDGSVAVPVAVPEDLSAIRVFDEVEPTGVVVSSELEETTGLAPAVSVACVVLSTVVESSDRAPVPLPVLESEAEEELEELKAESEG